MKKIAGLKDSCSLTERYPELAALSEERRGLPELASALIQIRARTGQKQSDLAAAAGVQVSLISELENARNSGVTLRTLIRIAKGAGANFDMRFNLDPDRAGSVDIHVTGNYTEREEDEIQEVAALIDERNESMRRIGCLAA